MVKTGVITHWNESAGYGFIRADDGGEDVFILRRDLRGVAYLSKGERVEYEARMGERGMRADYAQLVS